jgi:hypothetical protein
MNKKKVLVGVAGLAAAGSLVGLGAGASFTDSASAAQNITRGSINLGVGTSPGNTGQKSVSFTDPGPVDSQAHDVNDTLYLHNYGNLPEHLQSVDITGNGPETVTLSALGVSGIGPGHYDISGAGITIPAGGDVSYPLTFSIPAAADNSAQGQTSGLTLTLNGTD